jgi:hypothetical protein
MSRDRILTLQHRCIETINEIVECDDGWEDRHAAIKLVRAHLDARAEQTKPEEDEWLS